MSAGPDAASGGRLSLNVHFAIIRETWHATTLKADYFPAATAPEDATARYYVLE